MHAGVRIMAVTVAALKGASGMAALLAEYAAEAKSPELPEAEPQWLQYDALERAGLLTVFAAAKGTELIGFCAVLYAKLPHYNGALMSMESVFVGKAHRHTGAGLGLIDAAEALAAKWGVAFMITAPTGSVLDMVLEHRPGYRCSNRVFVKGVQ